MIRIKDHKTPYIFDQFGYLGPKRRKLLDKSWAGIFRKYVLMELPVEHLAKNYPSQKGRPTKELYAMMGALLIQQTFDLTDVETVHHFSFDLSWHYALDITDYSDDSSYLSLKTLWTMRDHIGRNNIQDIIFNRITDKFIKEFNVSTKNQRLDSMHIESNMRHLGRIGIFVKCIKSFLRNLKRHHKGLFQSLDSELREKYLTRKQENIFSMVKPSESSRTLEELSKDLFFLVERFRNIEKVNSMTTYQHLVRVLREQCLVEYDDQKESRVSVKKNSDVPSSSLQNPSDPDAGYDAHKGKGYQVQLAETYSTETDTDGNRPLSLLTYAEAEPAHLSDTKALKPMLDKIEEQDRKPEKLLADTLYGSDENCQYAKDKDVELISPTKSSPNTDNPVTFEMFTFADNHEVLCCPAGHAPFHTHHNHKKERVSACFDSNICSRCDKQDECPTQPGKKGRYLRYSHKDIRLLRRRKHEQSIEFQDEYRYRAGIEATNSELNRRTGIKKLIYRGLAKIDYCVKLKAAALNILRVAAYCRRKGGQQPFANRPLAKISVSVTFKELIFNWSGHLWPKISFISGKSNFQDVSAG